MSRSKKSSGTRESQHDNDYEYPDNVSKSSKSKKYRDKSQARQVMKNNLSKGSYHDLIKIQNNK